MIFTLENSFVHGLSPFSNKFAIRFLVNVDAQLMVILKIITLNFLDDLDFESFLCCITVNV